LIHPATLDYQSKCPSVFLEILAFSKIAFNLVPSSSPGGKRARPPANGSGADDRCGQGVPRTFDRFDHDRLATCRYRTRRLRYRMNSMGTRSSRSSIYKATTAAPVPRRVQICGLV
jgi:hypothetical protein